MNNKKNLLINSSEKVLIVDIYASIYYTFEPCDLNIVIGDKLYEVQFPNINNPQLISSLKIPINTLESNNIEISIKSIGDSYAYVILEGTEYPLTDINSIGITSTDFQYCRGTNSIATKIKTDETYVKLVIVATSEIFPH